MSALFARVRPLLYLLWVVAAIRLILDATVKPGVFDLLGSVSVYYAITLSLIVIGVRGTWDDLGFKKLAGACLILGIFACGVPNAVSYTTAQFQGWSHGRFRGPSLEYELKGERDPEARGPAIQEGAARKIAAGAAIGGITTLTGTIGSLILASLFVYLPSVVRRRRRASPTA